MTIYIAASFALKEHVAELYALCEKRGYTVSHDWTQHTATTTADRLDDPSQAVEYAIADVDGVRNADVFVMLADGPAGTGRYIELGVAIQSHLERGTPQIFIVGEANADSIFYFHPSVQRVDTMEDVFAQLTRQNR